MSINEIILYLLYFLPVVLFLGYFGVLNTTHFLSRPRKYFNKTLVLFFLGILLASLVGLFNGKMSSKEALIDFLRVINFLVALMMPFVLLKLSIFRRKSYKSFFTLGLIIFTTCIGVSLFLRGVGGSFFGSFLAASTINLSMVSLTAYYGFFSYYVNGNRYGLYLSILAWVISLASLAKWNFWVDVTIPLLYFKAWVDKKEKGRIKRTAISLIVGSILIAIFILNFGEYFNTFAALNDYQSFNAYLKGRVLHNSVGDNSSLISVNRDALVVGGIGISDGARFSMWFDLIKRTLNQPFVGLGFGIRAFGYLGDTVEDHNIIIYLLSRFGFIVGGGMLYYIIKLFRSMYKYTKIKSLPLIRYIYIGLVGNFFFQALVGMNWGQLPVTVLLGLILSMIFSEFKKGNGQ